LPKEVLQPGDQDVLTIHHFSVIEWD